jgi:hypothetical protein
MNLIAKDGVVKAAFSCKTKDLREVLKFVRAGLKKTEMEDRPYCEITIKTNAVEFAVDGARKTMYCEAVGPGRLTISFAYFLHLVQDRPRIQTKVSIGDDFMTINETTVAVTTWFFKDDSILRSIDLPLNYGIADVLRLPFRYTNKEIEFNKLAGEYLNACSTLNYDTKSITSRLKKYCISKDEVEKFIHDKIFKQQLKQEK